MKRRVYFVSYSHVGGNGCCEILMNGKIESYEDIKTIIKIIGTNQDVVDPIIMWFKELKHSYKSQEKSE